MKQSRLTRLAGYARVLGFLAVTFTVLAHPAARAADDFPSKPLRLVVPFSPGGSTDVIARMVAKEMSGQLGQPVIVENRDGASGAIATDYVAKAPPDGYTLCYCTTGSIAILPLIDTKLSYKPERDLAAVTHAVNQPFAIVVRSSLGVNNFKEFIALAKANPGKFSFGSPGAATPSHLTGELLKIATGIDIRHVSWRHARGAGHARRPYRRHDAIGHQREGAGGLRQSEGACCHQHYQAEVVSRPSDGR